MTIRFQVKFASSNVPLEPVRSYRLAYMVALVVGLSSFIVLMGVMLVLQIGSPSSHVSSMAMAAVLGCLFAFRWPVGIVRWGILASSGFSVYFGIVLAHKDSIDLLMDHFEFAPAKSMRFRAETLLRRDGLGDVTRPQSARALCQRGHRQPETGLGLAPLDIERRQVASSDAIELGMQGEDDLDAA